MATESRRLVDSLCISAEMQVRKAETGRLQ